MARTILDKLSDEIAKIERRLLILESLSSEEIARLDTEITALEATFSNELEAAKAILAAHEKLTAATAEIVALEAIGTRLPAEKAGLVARLVKAARVVHEDIANGNSHNRERVDSLDAVAYRLQFCRRSQQLAAAQARLLAAPQATQ